MKQDLETLRLELEEYLAKKPFVVFHGLSRAMEEFPNTIQWDHANHPDFRGFVDAAEKLGVPVMVVHTRRLTEEQVDHALEDLADLEIPFDERRDYERRLKEIRMYSGFTCAVEMSFDHQGLVYLYSRATDWYEEVMSIIEDIETAIDPMPGDDTFGGGGGNGGYFSKN